MNESIETESVLQRLFWRVHFWAGLIISPIVLFAAISGLIYVFNPQIEAWRHANLDHVAASATVVMLDQQVEVAKQTLPEQSLRYVVPARQAGETTKVYFESTHAKHDATRPGDHNHRLPDGNIIYINPHTGAVVGSLAEMQRFQIWAKKLHSTFLQGDGWRWLIELAASWMLVLFATGLVLWWPRSQTQNGHGWRALIPRWGRGRRTWRDLHTLFSILISTVLVALLLTGLTWSKYTGTNFRDAQKALGQSTPRAPNSLKSSAPESRTTLSWQYVYDAAKARAPDVSIMLTPPKNITGFWKIENFDRGQPQNRFNLALDQYTGQTLFYSDWDALPPTAKATALGIPFHRGEFGLWNQLLLVLAALVAIFSVISGFVMWWKRRPISKLAAPTLTRKQARAVPFWVWLAAIILGYAMPVFGTSLLIMVVIEVAYLALPRRTL